MKSFVVSIGLCLVLNSCQDKKPQNHFSSECKYLSNQGTDSIRSYWVQPVRKKSTLFSSLQLFNQAIQCDSNLLSPRLGKINIFNELGEYDSIVPLVDHLLLRGRYDSSILIAKGRAYEKIKNTDLSLFTYKKAHEYFIRKLKDKPDEAWFIYYKILSMSKIEEGDKVQSEINYYLSKYPEDQELKALLTNAMVKGGWTVDSITLKN